MNHLKARKDRVVNELKEKLSDYEIRIEKGGESRPKLSFFPPTRHVIINYPRSHPPYSEYLPLDEIPEEFKIIHRANNALICSDAIRNGGLSKPVPNKFLETEYEVHETGLLEKNKFARDVFEFPLRSVNEGQLREVPHFYLIDREIKRVWFERYAESTLRELKRLVRSEYLGPSKKYSRYSNARVDLRIAHDLSKAKSYDFEIPKEYYGTAGYRLKAGNDLYKRQEEMGCETFEDLTDLVNDWLSRFGFESEFIWVRTNQIY